MPSQDPNFLERLQSFLEGKNRKNQDDVPKCNILLIGRTGIGKSTLINGIFRVDLAPAGSGKPVTGKLTKYSQPGCPIIAFDSRGLELRVQGQLNEGDINKNIQDVEALITGNHQEFPQEKIDVIYYCISPQNPRFEDVEESWVNSLMQFKIPIILVMTKVIEDIEQSGFFKYFRDREERGTGDLDTLIRCVTKAEEVVQDKNQIPVVPVLAKSSTVLGGIEIPPYNLDILVTQTASLLEEQPRQAFISQQIASIDLKVKQSQQLVSIYTAGLSSVSGLPGPTEAMIPVAHNLMLEQISSIFGLTDEEQDSLLKSEKFQELLGVTVASSVSSLIGYYIPIFGQIQSVVVTGASTSALGLAWIEVLKHRYSKLVENQTLSPEDIQTFIDDFVAEYKKYCDGIG